jgi:GTP-sensing pleiotropic transcriptional regulator CodY
MVPDDLNEQLAKCRETNARLNRRAQLYAKGMEEKIEKGRDEYRNLGRIFANATAAAYERKLEIIAALCPKDHPLGAEILNVIERPFSDDQETV